MPEFELEIEGNRKILHVAGEVIGRDVSVLRDRLAHEARSLNEQTLIVDVLNLTRICGAAVSVLSEFQQGMRDNGGTCLVLGSDNFGGW